MGGGTSASGHTDLQDGLAGELGEHALDKWQQAFGIANPELRE